MAFDKLYDIFFVKDGSGDLISNPGLTKSVLDAKGTLVLSVDGENGGESTAIVTGDSGAVSSGSVVITFNDGERDRQIIIQRSFFGTGMNRISAFSVFDTDEVGPIAITFWDGYNHQKFEFFKTTTS